MKLLEWGTKRRSIHYGKHVHSIHTHIHTYTIYYTYNNTIGTGMCAIVKKTVNTHTHACDIVYAVILFTELPYGDQGLFMWRNTFDSVGGYPIYRLMEDFEMVCVYVCVCVR